jgi:hypothetical protein
MAVVVDPLSWDAIGINLGQFTHAAFRIHLMFCE